MFQYYPVNVRHDFLYEVNKDFHFFASHRIPDQQAGQAYNLHGHTFYVCLTFAGNELNEMGQLANYYEIERLIRERFDHKFLNGDPLFGQQQADRFPSMETIAETIYSMVQDYLDQQENGAQLIQVIVRETPNEYCVFRPKAVWHSK